MTSDVYQFQIKLLNKLNAAIELVTEAMQQDSVCVGTLEESLDMVNHRGLHIPDWNLVYLAFGLRREHVIQS